ncbi:MAG TPA: diguanylate cyclase, partial [Xanthobacteraceae bacterium]|nr:diguanylate cyclase [Xanthobacteraceae bacterium]
LGIAALLLRLPVIALLLLFCIFVGPRLSGRFRETFLTIVSIATVNVFALLHAVSNAPFALYGFTITILALIYGNTTIPLRFAYACIYTGISCAIMIPTILLHTGIEPALSWAIVFQIIIGASFSLITNYRIERKVRLNYLLSAKEALRLSLLSADREILMTRSNTDALTGFVNRGYFDRQSATLFASRSNTGKEVALLFIDVDYFKRYNDFYGHPAGDACLRAVATAVSGTLRGINDLAARYGGEEFAILLVDVKQDQVESIAERVRQAVQKQAMQHLNRSDGISVVTISVGVAYGVIGEGLTIDSLIKTADRALYTAKREGRNRVAFRFPQAA